MQYFPRNKLNDVSFYEAFDSKSHKKMHLNYHRKHKNLIYLLNINRYQKP